MRRGGEGFPFLLPFFHYLRFCYRSETSFETFRKFHSQVQHPRSFSKNCKKKRKKKKKKKGKNGGRDDTTGRIDLRVNFIVYDETFTRANNFLLLVGEAL